MFTLRNSQHKDSASFFARAGTGAISWNVFDQVKMINVALSLHAQFRIYADFLIGNDELF